jgi:hypothetical protein
MKSSIKKRPRTIEKEKSKSSPPDKMSRKASRDFTINDVMYKIDEMKDELKGDLSKIWEKLGEVEELKKKVTEFDKMRENFQRFEIEEKKKSVLIKGLKSASSKKFETRQETKASLDELFDFISLKPIVTDYHRMGPLEHAKSEETLIRVRFSNLDEKGALFRRFKEMGDCDRLKKISLINDYPNFQLDEVKRLSRIAFDLRKAKKGTRTRIVPRGLNLALQKLDESGKWINVSRQEGTTEA